MSRLNRTHKFWSLWLTLRQKFIQSAVCGKTKVKIVKSSLLGNRQMRGTFLSYYSQITDN